MSANRINPMYSLLPPFPIYDNFNRIIVVSDSQYKAHLEKQAREEILVLENRRNRYEAAITDINTQIAAIEKSAGIETSTAPTTLSGGSEASVPTENEHAN